MVAVETLHFAPAHMLYEIEAAARAAGREGRERARREIYAPYSTRAG